MVIEAQKPETLVLVPTTLDRSLGFFFFLMPLLSYYFTMNWGLRPVSDLEWCTRFSYLSDRNDSCHCYIRLSFFFFFAL